MGQAPQSLPGTYHLSGMLSSAESADSAKHIGTCTCATAAQCVYFFLTYQCSGMLSSAGSANKAKHIVNCTCATAAQCVYFFLTYQWSGMLSSAGSANKAKHIGTCTCATSSVEPAQGVCLCLVSTISQVCCHQLNLHTM